MRDSRIMIGKSIIAVLLARVTVSVSCTDRGLEDHLSASGDVPWVERFTAAWPLQTSDPCADGKLDVVIEQATVFTPIFDVVLRNSVL